jgi:hypothetical protein
MSVYSDILKRSYFDGSMGKALQNFADQSGSSALDTDCVRPNTGTSSDARRTGGVEIFAGTGKENLQSCAGSSWIPPG